MGELALLLYLIGFAATATSPMDEAGLFDRPLAISLLSAFMIAVAWPILALIMVAGRFWRTIRG